MTYPIRQVQPWPRAPKKTPEDLRDWELRGQRMSLTKDPFIYCAQQNDDYGIIYWADGTATAWKFDNWRMEFPRGVAWEPWRIA